MNSKESFERKTVASEGKGKLKKDIIKRLLSDQFSNTCLQGTLMQSERRQTEGNIVNSAILHSTRVVLSEDHVRDVSEHKLDFQSTGYSVYD